MIIIKRREILIVVLLLAVCAAAGFFLYRPAAGGADTVAVISVDGAELRRIPLAEAADGVFSIEPETGKPVSFEVKARAIRFVNVTCPDHVCEKAGWCDAPGERAVCMPNRTTLICYRAEELT